MVKHLPTKSKALSTNFSATMGKKEKRKEREKENQKDLSSTSVIKSIYTPKPCGTRPG